MILLAEKQGCDGNIEYVVHDLTAELPASLPSQYDFVTSQYLLCYAKTLSMLESMVQNCFKACKPGAWFISLTDNPCLSPLDYSIFKPFGFIKTVSEDAAISSSSLLVVDGQEVEWRFSEPAEFTSVVNVWRPETYESIFKQEGFVDIEWFGLTMPVEFLGNRQQQERLSPIVTHPHVVGIKARRPESSNL